MAEAIALAASVAGLASLAIQLGDGIVKLHTFLKDAKETPQRLLDILSDLEDFKILLEELTVNQQRHPNAATSGTNTGMTRCLSKCELGVKKITEVVTGLEQGIKKKRKFGLATAVLRKSELEELCNKLERAKISLSLAHQMYQR